MTATTLPGPSRRPRIGRLLLILLRNPRYVPPVLVLAVCALLVRGRRLVALFSSRASDGPPSAIVPQAAQATSQDRA